MKLWFKAALTASVFLMACSSSQADILWTFSNGGGGTTLVTFSGSTSSPLGHRSGFQGSSDLPFNLFDGGFVFGTRHSRTTVPQATATDIGTTFVGSVSGAHTLEIGDFGGINFSGEADDPNVDNVFLNFAGSFLAGETITASGAVSIDFPFSTILAKGTNPFTSYEGASHAIVVSPIPEPTTSTLALATTLFHFGGRRR